MPETDIEAIRAYWTKRSTDYDAKYDASDVRQLVAAKVVDLVQSVDGLSILDVGFGTGRLYRDHYEIFRHAKSIVGLEIAPGMRDLANARMADRGFRNFRVIDHNYIELGIAAESIDLAISTMALHQATDRDKIETLASLRKVVKPDGRLIIADQLNCTGLDLNDEELRIYMVRTFFPDLDVKEAVRRTSVHPEYTCSLERFAEMAEDAGFNVGLEKIAEFVGIIYTK